MALKRTIILFRGNNMKRRNDKRVNENSRRYKRRTVRPLVLIYVNESKAVFLVVLSRRKLKFGLRSQKCRKGMNLVIKVLQRK